MNDKLKVFGGVIGSSIVFPASIAGFIGSVMALGFNKGVGGLSIDLISIALILSSLTMIGTLSTIGFTIMNYVKPENELTKIASIIILVTGVIAIISILFMILNLFHWILLVILPGVLGILVSGLLQMGSLDFDK